MKVLRTVEVLRSNVDRPMAGWNATMLRWDACGVEGSEAAVDSCGATLKCLRRWDATELRWMLLCNRLSVLRTVDGSRAATFRIKSSILLTEQYVILDAYNPASMKYILLCQWSIYYLTNEVYITLPMKYILLYQRSIYYFANEVYITLRGWMVEVRLRQR